ncbi:MAG: EamA family transporter [Anaerolineales bacterium]
MILLSLGSALLAAVATIMAKYLLHEVPARRYLSFNFAVISLLLLPGLPFFFYLTPTWRGCGVLFLTAMIDGFANVGYFKALERLEASIASPLLGLAPLFTLLLAPLFAAADLQTLTLRDSGGIILMLLGGVLLHRAQGPVADEAPNPQKTQPHRARLLLLPLGTAVGAAALFGGNVYLVKYLFTLEITNPYTYYLLRVALITALSAALWRPDWTWLTARKGGLVAGRAALVIGQWQLFLHAVARGHPGVVKAVSETTPLFVALLSALALHERLTRRKLAGIGLVIGGLWVITV